MYTSRLIGLFAKKMRLAAYEIPDEQEIGIGNGFFSQKSGTILK